MLYTKQVCTLSGGNEIFRNKLGRNLADPNYVADLVRVLRDAGADMGIRRHVERG